MNVFEQAILFLIAVAIAVGVWIAYGGREAGAIDVDMSRVACYEMVGESVSKTGVHVALVFDQCDRAFRWVKIPAPPDAEV